MAGKQLAQSHRVDFKKYILQFWQILLEIGTNIFAKGQSNHLLMAGKFAQQVPTP